MTVRVLWFASLRDRTGSREETLEIQPTDDVEALWHRLTALHPRLRDVTVRPLVACDRAYAAWDRPLQGVREVAFLPPVSGG
ncbi:MAG TPA: MoaD/ThiS family protein [Candidatus Polarisedimenticolaceae bacterium]|nr:MoaD/ThiS family protein [Candidatus Polarisedimenticolaceae bacterium]